VAFFGATTVFALLLAALSAAALTRFWLLFLAAGMIVPLFSLLSGENPAFPA
jgi:hypothetical protein